jgi:hypothetical protein
MSECVYMTKLLVSETSGLKFSKHLGTTSKT